MLFADGPEGCFREELGDCGVEGGAVRWLRFGWWGGSRVGRWIQGEPGEGEGRGKFAEEGLEGGVEFAKGVVRWSGLRCGLPGG